MLHKSFKPAKCKTALKLAASRIKLLKNKKDAQVKQLKRDVAQLLESGQDQTARIRVEHVVREEKMMAAYDLIEIFCELIAARLQMIESQKNCPIDLKEAVTSLVFASPRCADIPELMDVRKHFTAKYGKEFINAAIELRPDCGVNRMLVEKLSATAPDGPTKLKILTAIAEEHNIKWEPKSFGEKDSKYYEDLLNGPKTFEDASKMHRGAPNVQTQYYEKEPPTADVTPQTEWKQNASQKFQGDNIGSSFDYQHNTQAHPSVSAFSPSELKPSVDEREPMEHRRAYSGDMKDGIMGNQDWKMEFKDATSAAQAAAESAERASMAARAAAELSSRGRSGGRYASELQKPSGYGFGDEHLERSRVSSHQSEVFAREQASTNVERRTHQMQNEPTNISEHYYHGEAAESYQREGQKNINESSQFGSSKLRMGSVDNDLLHRPSVYGQNDERHVDPNSHDEAAATNPIGNSFKASITRMQRNQIDAKRQDGFEEVTESFYRESHKNTPEFSQSYSINSNTDGSHDKSLLNSSLPHGVYIAKNFSGPENNSDILDDGNLSRKSSRSEAEFVHEISNDAEYKNSNDWEDRSYRKHSMHVSSHSQTSLSHSSSEKQDVWNLNNNNFEDDATENPFARFDEGKSHKDTGVSYGGSAVHYDNYGDDGNHSFDLDKGPESSFDHPSTSGSSLSHMFSDNHTPSPGSIAVDPFQKSTSHSPFFTEQPSSKVSQSVAGSAFREEPDELPPPSFDEGPSFDKEVEREDFSGDDKNDFGIGFSKKYVSSPKRSLCNMNSKNRYSFDDVHDEKSHQGGRHLESSFIPEVEHDKFEVQLPDSPDDSDAYALQESGFGSGPELSLGKLTGGLRNKGHKQPPYVRSSMGETSSPKEAERVSSPLKVSVDSISSGDPHSKDNGTEFRSRPGTRMSASGTNVSQDGIYFSEDSPAVLTSNDIPGSFSQKLGPEKITRSSSRESIASTDSMQSNTDNNSQAQVSSGKTRFGSGLSRRTKPASANTVRVKSTFASEESASPENSSGRAASLRSSYQESTFASEEPENLISGPNVKSSSRSSNSFKSSLKPQSGTIAAASSSNRAGSNLKSKFAHEESQTQELDEDIKYSPKSSYAVETPIKSQSGTRTAALGSDRLGFNRRRSRYASGELQTEHDDSVKASVRSSYTSGSSMESRPETDQLDDRRTGREYRLPKEATVRPMAKPTGSSPEGSLRSRAEELEKTSSTGAAPESLQSADKRASHVHPKLPDYDTFAATLQAFRANRQ